MRKRCDYLETRINILEQSIRKLCNHKQISQCKQHYDNYTCDICGKFFTYIEIPKGSIVCKYECKVIK